MKATTWPVAAWAGWAASAVAATAASAPIRTARVKRMGFLRLPIEWALPYFWRIPSGASRLFGYAFSPAGPERADPASHSVLNARPDEKGNR
ncbi:hypothetical protein GCM10023148_35410 [Actinokineospora soli]